MYEKAASRLALSQPSIPDTNHLISGSTNTDARVQRNRMHVRPLVPLSPLSAPFYYPLFLFPSLSFYACLLTKQKVSTF